MFIIHLSKYSMQSRGFGKQPVTSRLFALNLKIAQWMLISAREGKGSVGDKFASLEQKQPHWKDSIGMKAWKRWGKACRDWVNGIASRGNSQWRGPSRQWARSGDRGSGAMWKCCLLCIVRWETWVSFEEQWQDLTYIVKGPLWLLSWKYWVYRLIMRIFFQ